MQSSRGSCCHTLDIHDLWNQCTLMSGLIRSKLVWRPQLLPLGRFEGMSDAMVSCPHCHRSCGLWVDLRVWGTAVAEPSAGTAVAELSAATAKAVQCTPPGGRPVPWTPIVPWVPGTLPVPGDDEVCTVVTDELPGIAPEAIATAAQSLPPGLGGEDVTVSTDELPGWCSEAIAAAAEATAAAPAASAAAASASAAAADVIDVEAVRLEAAAAAASSATTATAGSASGSRPASTTTVTDYKQ